MLRDNTLTAPGIHLLLTTGCDNSALPKPLPPAASIHSREKGRDGGGRGGVGGKLLLPLGAKWVGRGPAGIPAGGGHPLPNTSECLAYGSRDPGMEGTWSQPNVGLHGRQQQLAPVGRPNWRMGFLRSMLHGGRRWGVHWKKYRNI